MFPIRDLIVLPHLNKVGIKYKDIELEFIVFLSFSCASDVFIEEIVNQIRKFS